MFIDDLHLLAFIFTIWQQRDRDHHRRVRVDSQMKTSTSYYSFWFFLLFRSSSSSLAMPKVARFFLKSFNVKSAAKTSRKVSLLSTSFSRQKDFQEDSITTFTTSKEIGTLLYFGYGVTFMWVVMYTVWKSRKFTLTLFSQKFREIDTVCCFHEIFSSESKIP